MNENNVIIYQAENNITRVSVRFSDEDIWLTQGQIAELYDMKVFIKIGNWRKIELTRNSC
ncbi:MAG: hypothetical protein K2G45_09230 [Lachnospiraceae bacterium]|nr:hypothetical protein [Lachnospiraceae bacterium]